MMMNHRYILFAGLMVTALCIHAQDATLQTKEKYEYADATQLWRRTLNPAGLSLDTLTNRGISYFEFSHQQGTHYQVQDGDEQNQLLFTSERYQKIGKHLYGYGRFTFDMGRQFNRSLSDVLRSHHSNLGSIGYFAYQQLYFRCTVGLSSRRPFPTERPAFTY